MNLAPLKPAANKLYSVRLGERFYCTRIEAPNASAAIASAETSYPKYTGKAIDCTAEDIYEASIGLFDEHSETENGIFEISIRGCDQARVQQLKMAIVKYIGGPFSCDDQSDIGNIHLLENALQDLCIDGY